jgi:hypothetical protein
MKSRFKTSQTAPGTAHYLYLDSDGGLVVAVGGEGLRLLGGNGSVPLDKGRHHAARRLNAQRKRCHVQQQKVGHRFRGIAHEDGGLDSGPVGHRLVRVDGLVQLLPVEEVLQQLLDLGNSGRPKNEKILIL